MIPRRLELAVLEALGRSPAVALLGPRQVGKTTIALNIAEKTAAVYLDLENRNDRQRAQDIEAFHIENREKLIILDEVQRLPELFASLRGIIDRERRHGNRNNQFLFLGSASLELLQQSSESLAGRIAYLELHPVDVLEYAGSDPNQLNQLWVRGGFPESLLAANDSDSLAWRLDFIKTYLERDIPALGPRIPAETLERFWTMLAHYQGALLNASQLARNLNVTSVTIARYLDLMTDLMLVRKLKPWIPNIGKRITKSPKVYVRDSGLVHGLLNISDYNQLLGHPVVGGSWEGFVIENLLAVAPPRTQSYYYGTPRGDEIDLVLEFASGKKWAIEIKRSTAPVVSKGFYSGCMDIRADQRFVVYSGTDRYPLGDNIVAISLPGLMGELQVMK